MYRRTPRWSALLVAVAAVIDLAVHTIGGIGVLGYERNLIEAARAASLDASAAAARVDPALVLINTDLRYQGAVGAGTGIVLDPNGEVLTNNHVVEGATRITATDIGTGVSYPADVVGYDRKHDVAVLQLRDANGLPTAPLGDSSHVAVGDPILGIGNAGGKGLSRVPGTVSALGQAILASDDLSDTPEQLNGMIEVAANLRPGDSGGPLVNSTGQVVGIDTAGSGSYRLQGSSGAEGFAIPIDTALAIAGQIRSGNTSGSVHVGATALLGVGVGDPAPHGGITVRDVLRGSPADQVGIVPGDVITRFDGTAVDSATTLTDLLDRRYPGDAADVTWVDQASQLRSATVTLATGPVG
jgi:serine protease Do